MPKTDFDNMEEEIRRLTCICDESFSDLPDECKSDFAGYKLLVRALMRRTYIFKIEYHQRQRPVPKRRRLPALEITSVRFKAGGSSSPAELPPPPASALYRMDIDGDWFYGYHKPGAWLFLRASRTDIIPTPLRSACMAVWQRTHR